MLVFNHMWRNSVRSLLLMTGLVTVLVGCMETVPSNDRSSLWINKRPTTWTEEDDAHYATMLRVIPRAGFSDFCNNYRRGRAGGEALTQEDYADYEKLFRAWGMSSRDVELLRKRDKFYGTGQTYLGLKCSIGREPRLNKSFYQGVGHRWQAVLGEYSEFVYLEGDGTDTGMRVTGWN